MVVVVVLLLMLLLLLLLLMVLLLARVSNIARPTHLVWRSPIRWELRLQSRRRRRWDLCSEAPRCLCGGRRLTRARLIEAKWW